MYPGRILLPAILINPDTGSQLGQEVQLTNKIGHEVPKHVLPTDDGGFKILYQTGDMALNENGSYVLCNLNSPFFIQQVFRKI